MRCGHCGELGHYRNTCPTRPQLSVEYRAKPGEPYAGPAPVLFLPPGVDGATLKKSLEEYSQGETHRERASRVGLSGIKKRWRAWRSARGMKHPWSLSGRDKG